MKESKTIFCDIDGCLIEHQNLYHKNDMKVLEGSLEKIKEWDRRGYNLILTTGRRESARETTEEQLKENGITYDLLIMGLGPGVRVLINDVNPNHKGNTAISVNLNRNVGVKDVDI
tara:strand:- start:231 stop:578 length:348 start_codon:yes stop_codon:yes gene_type:complete